MIKRFMIFLFIILTSLICVGCSTSPETLTVARQFGLAYAPIEIMKENKFLEKNLSELGLDKIEIEWKQFGNTTAIREAMLSGDLDIGFVGIPPFLLGLDNGMDWKIISGVSESRVSLVSKDTAVQTLSDITQAHRIILPQPGSIQHILLQMGSEKIFSDPKRFDNQLLALSHPDGVIAYQSGDENQLHFTTPPYLQKDLETANSKEIIDGKTCFGDDFTFIVGICREELYDDSQLYVAFERALAQSIDFMNDNKEETIAILLKSYAFTAEDLNIYLSEEQMKFTSEIKGLERFVEFMYQNGDLDKNYTSDELIWKAKK